MSVVWGKMNYVPEAPHCPKCNALLDGATCSDGDHPPRPDDFSVCIHCHAGLRYMESLELRLVTEEDLGELDPDQRRLFEKMMDPRKGMN